MANDLGLAELVASRSATLTMLDLLKLAGKAGDVLGAWEASLNLTREAVKGAPPYDTSAHLNRDHAIGIFQHYGLPGYWAAEPTPEPVVAPL